MKQVKRIFKNILCMIKRWCGKRGKVEMGETTSVLRNPFVNNGLDMISRLACFLSGQFEFRFNSLTEETEFRKRSVLSDFKPVKQRELNSFCMNAREAGIDCWDRDISRYLLSDKIEEFHPFALYLDGLPEWDGIDRLHNLAQRVSDEQWWATAFHRWMLGMTAQWMGITATHANSVAPLLVSCEQGKRKSTFCKSLMPESLQRYYTDSVDLGSQGRTEQKLAQFGLVNLDEFDKFSEQKMVFLKNLMQMARLNIRKSYCKSYSSLPRIASFIGTSNRKELLTDPTGSRRFLCVEVTKMIDCSGIDHDRIYAQLKTELLSGERYWFTPAEEAEIKRRNLSFYRQLPEEDVFRFSFRAAFRGEPCQCLSAADIFKELKKKNPSAMRGAVPARFAKILVMAGVERVHTKQGNIYRVVAL